MQVHPVADIFPRMSEGEFAALKDDIRAHGVLEPAWVYQGQLVDGRHRWRACEELGIQCPTREYEGEDVIAFVVSLNLKRRHLNESQRALVAASIANLGEGRPSETTPIGVVSQAAAAELLNVSQRAVSRAAKVKNEAAPELLNAVQSGVVSVSAAADVSELPKQTQAEIVARGEREILEAAKKIRAEKAEARRTERVEKINEIAQGNAPLAAVGRKFPVIYCDPPWRYEHVETESRAIENQYPTMSLDEICALPLGEIAHDDAILFLWATSPKLAEAMRVLDAWGFTYRTCAAWDKEVIGMGYYFRQQHELLLVATRGELPTPLPANRPSSVIRARREEHSAKPDMVYELIEAMYPEFDKVEMFARRAREGWHAWGNQSKAA